MNKPFILNGKQLGRQVQDAVQARVQQCVPQLGRPPGLGVILVGKNPASEAYVRRKEKIAAQCGFETFDIRLSAEVELADVEAAIQEFNQTAAVDGILLQLPLPAHLNENHLIDCIQPAKDVDGLHPTSQGLLLRGEGVLRPCTPLGIMKLIDLAYYAAEQSYASDLSWNNIPEADLSGRQAVVIGRSILVGKAAALLLLDRNATVFVAHSRTPDIEQLCKQADILVAAVGVPHLVNHNWIKPGAVVIDVGINRLESGSLTGDVDFEDVAPHCAAITPVPGGVGPMTVAMLMRNTLSAYEARNS